MKNLQASKLIYFIFSFLLLMEWLKPLEVSTDTTHSYIFVIFIGVLLVLKYWPLKWYCSLPIKILFMLFLLHKLFFEGPFFTFVWLPDFLSDMLSNVSLLNGLNWLHLTPMFRTFLFFIMLWLLVYLIGYWIIQKHRIFMFLLLTVTYVAILDTFTPYDATIAIIRLVLVGFFMMGFLSFQRIQDHENVQIRKFAHLKWMLPLCFLISFSAIIGLLAPKAAPQWPDPVPYIKKIGQSEEETIEKGMSKIGYGTNDERLGGPFMEDDTPVFYSTAKKRHYWRVETKDVYTGKGWINSGEQIVKMGENVSAHMNNIADQVETEALTAAVEIEPSYSFNHLMYPVELKRINSETQGFLFYTNKERIEPFERHLFLSHYSVEYSLPEFQVEELRKINNESISQEFLQQYTQLPSSLPQRVIDLGKEITKNKDNIYDKVKAVEQYFQTNSFVYETKEVAIPKEHEDYVDQFLFETMKGYCDNFSTSMIVLLRSVGIPARWVKGYTQGEYVEAVDDGYFLYKVTNNNAHSWVEVYFNGIGWVPFEPTIGFQNPYDFTSNVNENDSTEEQDLTQTEQVQEETEENTSEAQSNWLLNNFPKISLNVIWIIVAICTFCLAIVGWKTRKKWLSIWLIQRFKHRQDEEVFFEAFPALLKYFEWNGLRKQNGQTLRQYAKYVDESLQTTEMSILTKHYEEALYRRSNAKDQWLKSVELWENLIKKASY